MEVIDLITLKKDCAYITSSMSIRQAMEKFDYYKFTVIPVLKDSGEYITTISEGDILTYIKNQFNFNVKEAEKTNILCIKMRTNYKSIDIHAKMDDIFKLSRDQNFVPLVDDRNMFMGIIRRAKIIEYYIKLKLAGDNNDKR